jgi:molybdopterin molybdotransferase
MGKIYNSNYYTLLGLMKPLGVDVVFPGIVKDDPEATRQALKEAAGTSDLVISSGGVSVAYRWGKRITLSQRLKN